MRKVLGLPVPFLPSREKAVTLVPPAYDRGWWPLVREPFGGAWQRNQEIRADTVLSNVTVFRCISLIASDIAKLRIKLIQQTSDGIWVETNSPSFSPVLQKPNHCQNRIQFIEHWIGSKLATGNTYVLKERDARQVVTSLYILDASRVRPLIADNTDIYYELSPDNIAGISETLTVPASEIIHDRWNTRFHPLVGLSPIFAAGLAATQNTRIQEHSTQFFANAANPGGLLIGPGRISDETAARLKALWEEKFTGNNIGRIAAVGDNLRFEPLGVTALNSQLIEQLKWSAENVASSFGVPAYKVGVGAAPAYNNIEALSQQYYEECLQFHIESLEECFKIGLALPNQYGIELDLDGLLRMDTATMVKSIAEAVGAGVLKIDEGRKKLGYGPVEGGDTPYLQEQNYSLQALAKRDALENPFGAKNPDSPPAPPPAPPPEAPVPAPTKAVEKDSDAEMMPIEFMAALSRKFAEAPAVRV